MNVTLATILTFLSLLGSSTILQSAGRVLALDTHITGSMHTGKLKAPGGGGGGGEAGPKAGKARNFKSGNKEAGPTKGGKARNLKGNKEAGSAKGGKARNLKSGNKEAGYGEGGEHDWQQYVEQHRQGGYDWEQYVGQASKKSKSSTGYKL